MKIDVLQEFRNEFQSIKTMEEPLRTENLTELMDRLESYYKIPVINYKQFEKVNSEVIDLYREVSLSRDFN